MLTLFSVSTTLEVQALGRARRAVESLMALRPETALRKQSDGSVSKVPAADLRVDDIVVLRPGDRVPADGVIVSGRGSLDEASITGKSMPVSKEPGGQVFEATVNLDGVLEVGVTKTIEESTVARMIALVTEAQAAKAPSERFSAWFGQRYTIAVMAGAALAFAAFYWLGRDWEDALYRSATCWSPPARAPSSYRCPQLSFRPCRPPRGVACSSRAARRSKRSLRSTLSPSIRQALYHGQGGGDEGRCA